MVAILNFRIFDKNRKLKIACISQTVRDRVILVNFLTLRVYIQGSLANFQKFFLFPKMAAILNF